MSEALKIEGLDCLYQQSEEKNSPAIIILHGYGASQNDLAPLAQYFKCGQSFHWYFPNAPLEVSIGPMMTGRAWYNIDMAELEKAMNNNAHERVFGEARPAGFEEAADQVFKFVQEIKMRHGKVILGGFSQGSMLSVDLALNHQELFAGLVLLSTSLVDRKRWTSFLDNIPKFKIFQSHGNKDPILPYHFANELAQLFKNKGADSEFHEFNGAHEIPTQILNLMDSYLNDLR